LKNQRTTPFEIKEEIVKMLQVERVYFKGKLPASIKDLPNRYSMPSHKNAKGVRILNKYWAKARTKIANSKRPKIEATPIKATPREVQAQPKDIHLTLTLAHDMNARAFVDFIAMVEKSGAKVFSV
tara:strand:+ start:62 stop:439 length:378 start_codon:yes stop_codon:yes gene_type:complete